MTSWWTALLHRVQGSRVGRPPMESTKTAIGVPASSPGSTTVAAHAAEWLETLLDTSTDGVLFCDSTGRILRANAAAKRHFLLPDRIGQTAISELLPFVARERPDEPFSIEARRCDGSTFSAEVCIATTASRSAPATCVVVRDISDRSQLEEQLRQAQKMDALGKLAGGVAHDFNNLLTVIFGNLDLARREVRDRPATAELLDEVDRASSRAADLTRQLLSFSRKRVLEQHVVSVDGIVRSAEKLFRRVLPESIVLETLLSADPAVVQTDPGQFEQALLNLVVNSRDAIQRAGSIVIETSVLLLEGERHHQFQELPSGRYVMLSVRDNGVGMSDEIRQRIFEPFFTTKALGQGTGLGLAMVYGIVTQSGGAVRVNSAPGRGTTFTILLPVVEGAASIEPARKKQPSRGWETILLVEDEAAVRASTRRILERSGYTVLEARHGVDALALWRAERERVALIVSDVRMPLMGGVEMVREIRHDFPDVRFLLMSGYAEMDASPNLAELGVPFIEKPFTVENLLHRVRELLDEPESPAA